MNEHWHARRDVRVEEVPDPILKEPDDAIIRITSSGLCGSDLHLYEPLKPFMGEADGTVKVVFKPGAAGSLAAVGT